jgi:alpha-methylacyl-CoA racemase
MFHAFTKLGYTGERGTHMLDGSAPFYDVYETKDGKFVSIGSIEPQFYQLLLEKTGASREGFGNQMNQAKFPDMKEKLAAILKTKTRDAWCALMEGTDVCFAPVLSLAEAPNHPHNVARKSYVDVAGLVQPAPAPKFSRTAPPTPQPATPVGTDTDTVLREFGFSDGELADLKKQAVVAQV